VNAHQTLPIHINNSNNVTTAQVHLVALLIRRRVVMVTSSYCQPTRCSDPPHHL